jgi:hypothetical protein
MSYNSFNVVRGQGGLNRRTPTDYSVCGLVGTGVAVEGKLNLGTTYIFKTPKDANLVGIDADYDTANNLIVYHHIQRFFLRQPSGTLYFMLAAQTVTLTGLLDKTNPYAKKLLKDAGGKVKYCGVFVNPVNGYTPELTTGLDGDVITAMANAQALYNDEASSFRYSGLLIEGRAFNGTTALALSLRTLTYPNVSVTILQDPAIRLLNPERWQNFASVGDVLGLKALAAISQDFGEYIDEFNLTDVASGAFTDIGISSGQLISELQDSDLALLDQKGYIFGTPVPTLDGFWINDTHTCSPIDGNDYAYIENNSVIEAAITLAQAYIIPKTKARLLVDSKTGFLLPEIKAALENGLKKSIQPLVDSGDISGGVDAQIPDTYQDDQGNTITQNILATGNVYYELTMVPDAIGRSITLRIGYTNPLNS